MRTPLIFIHLLFYFQTSTVTVHWTGVGGTSKWNTPANWVVGMPCPFDDVMIPSGYSVDVNANVKANSLIFEESTLNITGSRTTMTIKGLLKPLRSTQLI